MKELVTAFYELSVLDEKQTIPHKENFNLSNLLINLVAEYVPILESKNIQPEISLPEQSIFIVSDRNMVERILQNLLTNAIRYGAGKININLYQTEKNRVIFCVMNTVHNIDELDMERMFERFYIGDKSRHSESTGLGLAVVKLLTEKLGGLITASIHADILTIKLEL